jgi:mannosyltransferase
MNIVFDNIIFSLQNHGGISVVWYELYKRFISEEQLNPEFLKFNNINSLGRKLKPYIIVDNSLSKYPIEVQRYFNPRIYTNKKGIFHSSYYRTCSNDNFINITTIHDFTYEFYSKGLPKLVHSTQKLKAIKNSDKIICVSNNTKNDLLKFCPWVNENDVFVVHNGVSEDYFLLENSKTEIKKIIPFEHKEYALFVGDRRGKYKNFELVVKACGISNMPLVIVGGGILTNREIYLLESNLKDGKYFSILGISNRDLNVLYNSAAYLLYPSIYEGFGIPIIEAQKAGCPVICTNKSSVPEIAGKAALYLNEISPEEIANIILENKSRNFDFLKLKNDGLENSKKFSWDKCYFETKNVYNVVF